MEACRGKLFSYFTNLGCERLSSLSIQVRNYAARKGTRAKADKKKVKKEIQKVSFIPHNLRNKDKEVPVSKKSSEHLRNKAIDDVYISKFHAWKEFSFFEAIEAHKETHHPTIYNLSDSYVNLYIELDMSTNRPTKFADKFRGMALLPYGFDTSTNRSILVFCKTPEQKLAAQDAGATLVGGTEIIKDIEKGRIVLPDFQFVIAHPSILPEMITIRGLLKRKFPNTTQGTLGLDIGDMVTKFKNGVDYNALKDVNFPDYGWIDTVIGKLSMDAKQLEENFKTVLDDVNKYRPKSDKEFIFRVQMYSPPSVEKIKIDLTPYRVQTESQTPGDESSDDEEDVKQAVKS
uniref:39S ribosomal protein L1, mitochondrial n=1 Tax=Clastoptera arizonana TaxID=38151 RepID=A0A1B6CAE8_9HEMI